MCKKRLLHGTSSLRSKLVWSIVPLFLIGELIVISVIYIFFYLDYSQLINTTSNCFLSDNFPL